MEKTKEKKTKEENIKVKNHFFIDLYQKRSENPENFYLLPKVKYINYLNNGANTIFDENNENLYYFFDIDRSVLSEEPQRSCHISQSFSQNNRNKVDLDLFIAYFTWYAIKSWFTEDDGKNKLNVRAVKEQCATDIDRNNIIVNGQPILTVDGFEKMFEFVRVDKIRYVDKFNLYLMRILDSFNVKIELNMIFKINILICQNAFNLLLRRCIEPIIDKKFGNVEKIITGREKSVNINISADGQNVILIFNSLIRQIDKRGEIHEIGTMSYELLLDFNSNAFELTNFTLDYTMVDENVLVQGQEQEEEKRQGFAQGLTQRAQGLGQRFKEGVQGLRQKIGQQEQREQEEQDENTNPTTNKLDEIKHTISNAVGNNKPEMVALATTVGLAGLGSLLISGVLGGNAKTKTNAKTKSKKKMSNDRHTRKNKHNRKYNISRKQRKHKQKLRKTHKHIYTTEDLKSPL
jgi:hypothetical protein